MIVEQTTIHKAPSVSISEYAASLARSGVRVLPGGQKTFWIRHEAGSMMRIPKFHSVCPPSQEVRQVLWHGWVAAASYILEPDENHSANAWLYICTDQAYALDKLPSATRRNVRRGLKELMLAPITSEQLLAHGLQAFCDTRRRSGLSDGTPEEFHRWFTSLAKLSGVVYLGAWKDNQLAAFLDIVEVDDWVEFGCFSMDSMLHYRPNDTLIFSLLSHYLVERKFRVVSYGLSSIQSESKAIGLHTFKTKIGFEARPVHRTFVPHPLLIPFVNRMTLWGINGALRIWPGNRRLKKAGGVLARLLGDALTLEAAEINKNEL